MNYSPSKTLNENIFEQDILMSSDIPQVEKKEDDSFKEGCPSPEKTIKPPKTKAGNEGILQCCCYYPIPVWGETERGQTGGMYIPRTAKIYFWESYESFVETANELKKDKRFLKVPVKNIIDNLMAVIPIGTVRQFDLPQMKYYSWFGFTIANNIIETFYFRGYEDKNKKQYPLQVIADDRNDYQKFIDRWGTLIQFTTLIATAVFAVATGGSGLPLAAELALEMGIGLAVGIRDIQKGQEVAGVFSVITGMLPILKYHNAFKGINQKAFDELTIAFQNSKLSSTSKLSQFAQFYNKLKQPQKEVLDKILRGGDVQGKADIFNALGKDVAERLPNLLETQFFQMWKKYPSFFKKIPVFERLWVRELSSNVVVGVASYLAQWKFPNASTATKEGLTQEYIDKLDGVYENLPKQLEKEMSYLLISNPDKAEDFLNSSEIKEVKEVAKNFVGDKDNFSSGLINLYRKKMKDSAEKLQMEYPQTEEKNPFSSEKMTSDQIKKLKEQGYIEKDSLKFLQPYTDLRYVNDIYYVKPAESINSDSTNRDK